MDIDLKLKSLLKRYDLYEAEKGETFYELFMKEHLINRLEEINKEKKIAFWGAGEHTEKILSQIENRDIEIKYIIDKDVYKVGKQVFNIPIILPEEIRDKYIDIVFISSLAYRRDIANELKSKNIEYIDIYEILDKNSIDLFSFHSNKECRYISLTFDVFFLRKLYENEKDQNNKRYFLENLIRKYLRIRDFLYAEKFIKEYIENEYEDYMRFKLFLKELKIYLSNIEVMLSERVNRDCLLFICDGMRYKEIDESNKNKLTFFDSIKKIGVSYSNMFSASTYTRASFKSMFLSKNILDENLFEYKGYDINFSDSMILENFFSNGYYVYNDSLMYINDELERVINYRKNFSETVTCTEQLWRLIKNLLKNKKDIFYILHIMETHYPFVCGYKSNNFQSCNDFEMKYREMDIKMLKDEYNQCLAYVDEQLKYYLRYINVNSYKIITSDHGCSFGETYPYLQTFSWGDSVIKVPFIMWGANVKTNVKENLESMKHLDCILKSLIDDSEDYISNKKYIEVQRDAIYSEYTKRQRENLNINDNKYLFSYKVIRDNKFKYVVYENGKEELYLLDNENREVLNDYVNTREFLKLKETIGEGLSNYGKK